RQFAEALETLRTRARSDFRQKELTKEKVLATIIQLLEKTLIRVGGKEYAEENETYGLTTMLKKHVSIKGSEIEFTFVGKKSVEHEITLKDQKLAEVLRELQGLSGKALFQFVGFDDRNHEISNVDVNRYIKETIGDQYSAKNFRTWRGTVLAA